MDEETEKRLTSKIKQKKGPSFICHLCYLSTLIYISFPSPHVFNILLEFSTSRFLYSSLIFCPLYLSLYLLFPCRFILGLQLTLKPFLRPAPSCLSAPLLLLNYQATETGGATNATQSSTGKDGRDIFVIKCTEETSNNRKDAKKQFSLTTDKY